MDNLEQAHIRAVELAYSQMIQPSKLVEYFTTNEEFKEWAELGTASDLRACLLAFEKAELFDHCAILKEALNQKEDVQST